MARKPLDTAAAAPAFVAQASRLWVVAASRRQFRKTRTGTMLEPECQAEVRPETAALRKLVLQRRLVLIPLRIMAHRKKKRSRGEPGRRRADEFPECGAGVRACKHAAK